MHMDMTLSISFIRQSMLKQMNYSRYATQQLMELNPRGVLVGMNPVLLAER
jgi:hypothetical protein